MSERQPAQNYYETADLVATYDEDCAGRRDLDFYVALVRRLSPNTIVDIGSGTGLLASMLAEAGFDVIAVEPQTTMLKLAARQPYANQVGWLHGSAATLAPMRRPRLHDRARRSILPRRHSVARWPPGKAGVSGQPPNPAPSREAPFDNLSTRPTIW